MASTKTHQLEDGTDYYTINPLGYVPMLELDDGMRLREVQVVLQYIADLSPLKNLAPANGTLPRYRLQEWLSFTSSELHKNFGPLFNPGVPEETKNLFRDKLVTRFAFLDGALAGKEYITGTSFSVADCYLFAVTRWAQGMNVDLTPFSNVQAWFDRVGARPAVQEAMRSEGLLK